MEANYYVFVDTFTVPCDIETAYNYIRRVEDYPRWWGKVYKKIVRLKDAPIDTPGSIYAITFGRFLPYSLTLENEVTLVDRPHRIEFVATGDLQGKKAWLFRETEKGTEITFDWRVAANKKIIRLLSFLLKPLFKANHAYCVRKANEGLNRELATKQAIHAAV